jgi:hypothetical protein
MTIEIDINPSFIDVTTDWDCGWNAEAEADALCGLPYLEDVLADQIIPRSDWDEVIASLKNYPERLVTHIKNQGREGSCVGNGAAAAFEQCWNNQFGTENEVRISAMSMYKRIGRSAGSGAMVKDAMDAGFEQGFLPLDTSANKAKFKHTHPATGFSTRLPSGWEQTAKLFKYHEVYRVGTFAGAVTAVAKFANWVYGRRRHCICGVKLVKSGGKYYLKYRNSWGAWGDNGYGYDSESSLPERAISYGSFCVRSVIVPSFVQDNKV